MIDISAALKDLKTRFYFYCEDWKQVPNSFIIFIKWE